MTTPTQTGDKPMVTQVDADLVADILDSWDVLSALTIQHIRLGRYNGDPSLEMAARHREQETREQSRDVGREADGWHDPSEKPDPGEPVIAEYNEFDDAKAPIRLQTVWWYEGEWRTYPSLSDRAYVNRWRRIPAPEQPLDTIQRLGQEFDAPEASPSLGMGEELERWGFRWRGHDHGTHERMPDGYWTPWHIATAKIAALSRSQSPSDVGLAEENERLRAENERLTRAVGSGVLKDLLTPDESDEFVKFIQFLREQNAGRADVGGERG